MLQYVVLCRRFLCSVLQCVAGLFEVSRSAVAVCCSVLQYVAGLFEVRCSMLSYLAGLFAVHCSALLCDAVCCRSLQRRSQRIVVYRLFRRSLCSVLQCVEVCCMLGWSALQSIALFRRSLCSVLQRVAVFCSVLQFIFNSITFFHYFYFSFDSADVGQQCSQS